MAILGLDRGGVRTNSCSNCVGQKLFVLSVAKTFLKGVGGLNHGAYQSTTTNGRNQVELTN